MDLHYHNFTFISACQYASDALLNSDVCLTWNTRNQKLVVECKVANQTYDLSIAAPSDRTIVTCYNEETPYCSGINVFAIIKNENYTIIKVRTDMNNVEGEWKCRHGSSKKTVIVSFEEGNL